MFQKEQYYRAAEILSVFIYSNNSISIHVKRLKYINIKFYIFYIHVLILLFHFLYLQARSHSNVNSRDAIDDSQTVLTERSIRTYTPAINLTIAR